MFALLDKSFRFLHVAIRVFSLLPLPSKYSSSFSIFSNVFTFKVGSSLLSWASSSARIDAYLHLKL
jgi:hypothetical protein